MEPTRSWCSAEMSHSVPPTNLERTPSLCSVQAPLPDLCHHKLYSLHTQLEILLPILSSQLKRVDWLEAVSGVWLQQCRKICEAPYCALWRPLNILQFTTEFQNHHINQVQSFFLNLRWELSFRDFLLVSVVLLWLSALIPLLADWSCLTLCESVTLFMLLSQNQNLPGFGCYFQANLPK